MVKPNPTADAYRVLASVAADEEDGLADRLREGESEGDSWVEETKGDGA